MSTADTYVIGGVNVIAEDLLGFNVAVRTGDGSTKDLQIVRLLAVLYTLSIVFALFWNIKFTSLFDYMFYSANGFLGPLAVIVLDRRLKLVPVVLCLIGGFVIPLPNVAELLPEYISAGTAVVLWSSVLGLGLSQARSSISDG